MDPVPGKGVHFAATDFKNLEEDCTILLIIYDRMDLKNRPGIDNPPLATLSLDVDSVIRRLQTPEHYTIDTLKLLSALLSSYLFLIGAITFLLRVARTFTALLGGGYQYQSYTRQHVYHWPCRLAPSTAYYLHFIIIIIIITIIHPFAETVFSTELTSSSSDSSV